MSPVELACLTLRLMAQGSIAVGGVGTYVGWVHVDDRGRLALWRGAGVSDADWNRVQAAARSARAALAAAKEVGR
jgi:hypothetical protein